MERVPAALLVCALAVPLAGCTVPRWPVAAPMTSAFGMRWDGGPDLHRGVDLQVDVGTPVHAMAPGRVRFAGTMRGFGNVVWLEHGSRTLSVYAHLSRVDVMTGASVAAASVIGLSGQSGDVTGPHLHFEVWRSGREVDPTHLLGGFPPGPPPGP